MKKFWIGLIWLCSSSLWGQEVERFVPSTEFTPSHPKGALKTTLTLPFFDDFSNCRNVVTTPSSLLWQSNAVVVNNTMAIAPPTLGVATLDGLAQEGMPYDFEDQYAQGPADTLTSLGINLLGKDSADLVFLMFYFQAGGNGNMPDDIDSLYVDFFADGPAGWQQVWSYSSDNTTDWKRQFIQVTKSDFFHSNFQFRFRNDATVSGAFDQWNLDYIYLDEGVDSSNFIFDEVAMQWVPSPILEGDYQSMPWTHFRDNPTQFLKDTLVAYERNLGPVANIVTGYKLEVDGTIENHPTQVLNTFGNAEQELSETMDFSTTVLHDFNLNDSMVVAQVCTYVNPTDAHLQNDTACYQLELSNYYAYDDGSAERAWTVLASGAQVALKFYNHKADTLLGLMVNWIPYGLDNSDNTLLLRVWNASGSTPGTAIQECFNFQHPDYPGGHHAWSYHPLDSPQPMEVGNFFVGWVQSEMDHFDVGNDKNSNTNPGRLYYTLGSGLPWTASAVNGALLVRPVFRAGIQHEWDNVTESQQQVIRLFPNPSSDVITVQADQTIHELIMYDLMGRCVQNVKNIHAASYTLSVADMMPGCYMVQVSTAGGCITSRFIKS